MWKQSKTLSQLTEYPQGTFVHTETGYYYIVSPNKRFKFITQRVLASWAPQRIIETTEANLSRYRVGAKMKFRAGSLLWCQADAKMYLVSDNKIRHITNPDILSGLGAKHNDAIWVSLDEINLHEQGQPLN